MASDGDIDRRATPRYEVELPARFWTGSREDESGQVRDVSWGGLFLECDRPPPPGTPVRLMVGVSRAGEDIPLQGEVAWIAAGSLKGSGMGIRLDIPL
jgi:hypothetical protein